MRSLEAPRTENLFPDFYVDIPEAPQAVILLGLDGDRVILWDAKEAPGTTLRDDMPDLEGCSAIVPTNITANYPAVERGRSLRLPLTQPPIQRRRRDDGYERRRDSVRARRVTGEMGLPYKTPVMVLGTGAKGAVLTSGGVPSRPTASGPGGVHGGCGRRTVGLLRGWEISADYIR